MVLKVQTGSSKGAGKTKDWPNSTTCYSAHTAIISKTI